MDFFPKANYTKHLHMIDTSSKKNLIWHKRRPEILLDIKKTLRDQAAKKPSISCEFPSFCVDGSAFDRTKEEIS